MPTAVQKTALVGLALAGLACAGMIFRQRPRDERDTLHILRSNRGGFLAGIVGQNPLEKAAGMDVSRLMPFGTPAEIRAETRKTIREVGAEGGLLIGSSSEIGNDIPLANCLVFRDEAMR
jgi:hypothetical protein